MQKIKVYLDICCFNRPYDDQQQERIYLESLAKLHVQSLIVEEKIDFVWSFILEFENSKNPYNLRKESIRKFSYRCSSYVDIINKEKVVKEAKEIISSGIKEKDALHLACAILSESDYFLTTDDRLLKFGSSKIKILNPMLFISEMEATCDE